MPSQSRTPRLPCTALERVGRVCRTLASPGEGGRVQPRHAAAAPSPVYAIVGHPPPLRWRSPPPGQREPLHRGCPGATLPAAPPAPDPICSARPVPWPAPCSACGSPLRMHGRSLWGPCGAPPERVTAWCIRPGSTSRSRRPIAWGRKSPGSSSCAAGRAETPGCGAGGHGKAGMGE